jgi:glucokinase
MSQLYIGVDLGGTNIKAGLLSADGTVLTAGSIPTEAQEGPDAVIGRICRIIRSTAEAGGVKLDEVRGVGIGSPGTMDIPAGVVLEPPNLPGWRDVPLIRLVSDAVGLPCVLENDANAAAWGEFWAGAGRKVDSMVMLTLGTGIGGGIIIEGRLLHGANSLGGEIGHMCIVDGGRLCGCGRRGCLEAYASASHTAARALEALAEDQSHSTLHQYVGAGKRLTSRHVCQAAAAGDALAMRVFAETARTLALGIANLSMIVDPQRFVLAGGMIAAGQTLLAPVREHFRAMAFRRAAHSTQIVFATLGNDAGLIGAAGVAMKALDGEG